MWNLLVDIFGAEVQQSRFLTSQTNQKQEGADLQKKTLKVSMWQAN